MKKASFVVAILLVSSSCSVLFKDEAPQKALSAKSVPSGGSYTVDVAITDNITIIPDAEKYSFGTVQFGVAGKQILDGATESVPLRNKKMECFADMKKQLKVDKSKCSKDAPVCDVALSLTKRCGVRPIFMIKPFFSPDELLKCKMKARIMSVMALSKELRDINNKTSALSFIELLQKNGIVHKVDVDNGLFMRVSMTDGLPICLDSLIQPSRYSQDAANMFLGQQKLLEARSVLGQEAGYKRSGDTKNIGVFKVFVRIP